MATVYLHCGLHKTGTTAIQVVFDQHRAMLRARGVLYPSAGLDTAHHNLAWEVAGDRRFNPAGPSVAGVLAEIAGFDGDAVISSEDFESVLHRPDALAPITQPLRRLGREVCVLVCLRDRPSYRESLYIELIEHGYDVPYLEARDEIETTGALRWRDWVFQFDHDRIRAALAALPDVRVLVRSYQQAVASGSAVCDILAAIGQPTDLLGEAAFARINERTGAEVVVGMFCTAHLGRALTSAEQASVDRLCRNGAKLVDRPVAPAGTPEIPVYQLARVCSVKSAERLARLGELAADPAATAAAERDLARWWAADERPSPSARMSGGLRGLLRTLLGR